MGWVCGGGKSPLLHMQDVEVRQGDVRHLGIGQPDLAACGGEGLQELGTARGVEVRGEFIDEHQRRAILGAGEELDVADEPVDESALMLAGGGFGQWDISLIVKDEVAGKLQRIGAGMGAAHAGIDVARALEFAFEGGDWVFIFHHFQRVAVEGEGEVFEGGREALQVLDAVLEDLDAPLGG